LQFEDVIDLRPEVERLAADAAQRKRAPDAQFEKVHERRGRQALRDRLLEQIDPARAAFDERVRRVDLSNRGEG